MSSSALVSAKLAFVLVAVLYLCTSTALPTDDVDMVTDTDVSQADLQTEAHAGFGAFYRRRRGRSGFFSFATRSPTRITRSPSRPPTMGVRIITPSGYSCDTTKNYVANMKQRSVIIYSSTHRYNPLAYCASICQAGCHGFFYVNQYNRPACGLIQQSFSKAQGVRLVHTPGAVCVKPSYQAPASWASIKPGCKKADIALVIDSSGSIGSNWNTFMGFTDQMLNALPIGKDDMHVSLVVFASSYQQRIAIPLTSSRTSLLAARARLPFYRGGTYMGPAVRNAQSALSRGRSGVPKVMVMLTDGTPSDRPDAMFHAAKAAGIKVMIILIGRGITYSRVQNYVSAPSTKNAVSITSGFSALSSALSQITGSVCATVEVAAKEAGTWSCDDNVNFVNGQRYSQRVINDLRSGKARLTMAQAKAECKKYCTGSCTGFFYQKHHNGHQICGFYNSAVTKSASKHGHAEGTVCLSGDKKAPVDCKLTPFSSWSSCSRPCGSGVSTRARKKISEASDGGQACPAKPSDYVEKRACNTQPCTAPPTLSPTARPTRTPSNKPTHFPTISPTDAPTRMPMPDYCGESDVALLIDSSGSIGSNWNTFMKFTDDLLDNLPIAADRMHVSLVAFASSYQQKVYTGLMGDRAALHRARKNVAFWRGGTVMSPAVRNGMSVLKSGRPNVPKVLLMLTDGRPNDRPEYTFMSAKRAGIKTMMILVGTGITTRDVANYVSTPTSENAIPIKGGFSALEAAIGSITKAVCKAAKPPPATATPTNQPTLSPTNSPTDQPTVKPTIAPTLSPTRLPTEYPTPQPSAKPTDGPTALPTLTPTEDPTESPTMPPTETPTVLPSEGPTDAPTTKPPSPSPSHTPTEPPTAVPTETPTDLPTALPSHTPTDSPTAEPSVAPTHRPTSTLSPLQFSQPLSNEPCTEKGKLSMKFGGNLALFGDSQQKTLTKSLLKLLKLSAGELTVDRSVTHDSVHVHFTFSGTTSIELGYQLERDVESKAFNPLPDFPLIELSMIETYCTEVPTPSPSHVPTPSPTHLPTVSPTEFPTEFPTEHPTPRPTHSPTEHPTTLPPTTDEPTFAPTHTPTEHPTAVPTPAPTEVPTPSPTADPTFSPTHEPTPAPSHDPTQVPTALPTEEPTEEPTEYPTHHPTEFPTLHPTQFPTRDPTEHPTEHPTADPTEMPTTLPPTTDEPTFAPTHTPTETPTAHPTHVPTELPTPKPTLAPTLDPTEYPTAVPTPVPTPVPSHVPSEVPTPSPTDSPTEYPTDLPTESPTEWPTELPTEFPTLDPTQDPTEVPTPKPTHTPTEHPTTLPPTTDEPSFAPTHTPTEVPTPAPTEVPTQHPTEFPTHLPTEKPTHVPTETPTDLPTRDPTAFPTHLPTVSPTVDPTDFPTHLPTSKPTVDPTHIPTTREPTGCLSRDAKIHVLFLNKAKFVSRRLLMAAAFESKQEILLKALAKELGVATADLSSTYDTRSNGDIHAEYKMEDLRAIQMGYALEQRVLAEHDTFDPIPDEFPVGRLYMEENFDCGN